MSKRNKKKIANEKKCAMNSIPEAYMDNLSH